jgi:hypothetical protein
MAMWRILPAEHRRWLVVNALIATAVINAILNAGFAALGVAGQDNVKLWGWPLVDGTTTVVDTLGTFFILPLVTTLVVTTVIWREVRHGDLSPLSLSRGDLPPLERLPWLRLPRGVVIGAITFAVLTPPALIALAAAGPDTIDRGPFVLYKLVLGVGLGAVVTPVIALCAMLDARPPRA